MTEQDVYECNGCLEIKFYPQWSWIRVAVQINEGDVKELDLCHTCWDKVNDTIEGLSDE